MVTFSRVMPMRLRPVLLRLAGAKIGRKSNILDNCEFRVGRLSIGEMFACGYGVYIDASGSVTIGDRVQLSPFVRVLSADHAIMPSTYRRDWRDTILKETRIEDGVWVGIGATILAGVTVGEGCVVGAGAVVTASCEPNGLYVGLPARRVRDLPVETAYPFEGGQIVH